MLGVPVSLHLGAIEDVVVYHPALGEGMGHFDREAFTIVLEIWRHVLRQQQPQLGVELAAALLVCKASRRDGAL